MLTREERALPYEYPKGYRKEELIAFCKRYTDTMSPLTDTEKALIDGVALDVGKEIAPHIIAAVTSDVKYRHYYKKNVEACDEDCFYRYIRRFFNVLDIRKRKYEYQGKYIMDYFEGSVPDAFREMQNHIDNGWNIVDISTFCKNDKPYSVIYFQKLEPNDLYI